MTFEEKYSTRHLLVDDDEQNERKLRFWKYNAASNQFVSLPPPPDRRRQPTRSFRFELNTTIEYPHGQKTLNEMLFHPSKLQLVTTGNDGLMKIWSLVDENPFTSSVTRPPPSLRFTPRLSLSLRQSGSAIGSVSPGKVTVRIRVGRCVST